MESCLVDPRLRGGRPPATPPPVQGKDDLRGRPPLSIKGEDDLRGEPPHGLRLKDRPGDR